MAEAGPLPEVERIDEDDLLILATAVEGGAEVFVAGDKSVQALGWVGA